MNPPTTHVPTGSVGLLRLPRLLLGCLIIAVGALAVQAPAPGKDAALTRGHFKDRYVDELDVVQVFSLANYSHVIVLPLDSRGIEMPDDNTLAPTREALAGATEQFVEGLQEDMKGKHVSVEIGGEGALKAKAAGTIIVRARLTKLNPGSIAVRMFAGYGAGAAEAAISGEALDGRSGQPLFRFVQQRRSSMTALGSKNYVTLMNRSLKEIGGDVASILKAGL